MIGIGTSIEIRTLRFLSFFFSLKVPGNKDLFTSASTSAFPATFVFLCVSTTCQSEIPLTVYQHTPGKQTNVLTSMRATGKAKQMPYLMPIWQRTIRIILSCYLLNPYLHLLLYLAPFLQWFEHDLAQRLTPALVT